MEIYVIQMITNVAVTLARTEPRVGTTWDFTSVSVQEATREHSVRNAPPTKVSVNKFLITPPHYKISKLNQCTYIYAYCVIFLWYYSW